MARPKIRDAVSDLARQYEAATVQRDQLRREHAAAFAADAQLADRLADLADKIKPAVRPRYIGAESGMHDAWIGPVTTIRAIVRYGSSVDGPAIYQADPAMVRRLFDERPDLAARAMSAAVEILAGAKLLPAELVEAHTTKEQATTAIRFDRTADAAPVVDDRPLATVHKIR